MFHSQIAHVKPIFFTPVFVGAFIKNYSLLLGTKCAFHYEGQICSDVGASIAGGRMAG
jgi:hypothetical protein